MASREGNICNNRAVRVVPRIAGRVGGSVCEGTRANTSIYFIRVNNAVNSVRDRPFLRTVHRFSIRCNEGGYLFVRIALIPCLTTSSRLGSGPARRDIGRVLTLNVRPSIVIYHARRPLASSVEGGVTLFYGIRGRYIVRGGGYSVLCTIPVVLRGRKLSAITIGGLKLRYNRPSLSN